LRDKYPRELVENRRSCATKTNNMAQRSHMPGFYRPRFYLTVVSWVLVLKNRKCTTFCRCSIRITAAWKVMENGNFMKSALSILKSLILIMIPIMILV